MPDIAPLRGLLYDPKKVDVQKVLAPPYDVIEADERAKLAASDPHNCVRLILPEADAGGDPYAAAAKTLAAWIADGSLRRDDRRAVYRYHQVFTHADLGPREVTRTGFIAAVRLHDFSEGKILPHERTLRGPKEDRLKLMKATSSHFSQIFTMFRDAAGEVDRLFKKTERDQPVFNVQLADGTRHILWRCDDAEAIGKLRHAMAPKKLYIADGHHRYETMLALREHFTKQHGELSTYSAAQYGTMFLCNVDQFGMVVLPTHRILHSVEGLTSAQLLDKAKASFAIDRLDNAAGDAARIRKSLEAAGAQAAFVAVFPNDPHAYRMMLTPSAHALALSLAPRAIAQLDVTVLHKVLFEHTLGISEAAQEAQTNLRYKKDTASALAELKAPGTQAVFLLAPTKVETVTHVADAHEVMPQKSTFFYPKIASGVVINKIDPDEDLI